MPDMLVKLYELPTFEDERGRLAASGIVCRRAESYERRHVLAFVSKHWPNWVDEAIAGFAHLPPTVCVAERGGRTIGFAAYNATRPDYFGPMGVEESERKAGIGRVLLLQCLHALAGEGYAYAIIGGVGPAAFYERAVRATSIEGSDPGIYRGMLRAEDD
jgi:GNAT superfamily N-acetyltransferase